MANTIEGEWHDEATGTSPQLIGPNDYSLTFEKSGETTRILPAESVRYSPQINTAKKIRVDTKQKTYLEDQTYLGGTLKVDVGNDRLFEGEIKKIETTQDENDAYSIMANSPGLKLRNSSINTRYDRFIVYDIIGQIIDGHNDVDNKHPDMIDTGDESLSSVDKLGPRARGATASSGTATYSNVGTDASAIDTIYVKVYTPGTDDVTLDVKTASNTYSETFSSSDKNRYGEWNTVDVGTTFDGDTDSYNFEFTLQGDALLWNWSSLTSSKLTRVVDTPDVSVQSNDVVVVDLSTSSDFNDKLTIADNIPVEVDSDKIKLQQTSWFFEGEEGAGTGTRAHDTFSGNHSDTANDEADGTYFGGEFGSSGDKATYTFTPQYTIPASNVGFRFRRRFTDEDVDGNADNVHSQEFRINGETVFSWIDGFSTSAISTQWRPDIGPVSSDLTAGQQVTIETEQTSSSTSGDDEFWLDCLAVYDTRYNYDFDNTVTVDETNDRNYLDGPQNYPDAVTVQFNQETVTENIISAALSTTFDDTSNSQAIAVSTNGGTSWEEDSNTQSIDNSFPYNIGVSLDHRFTLSRYGSNTTSPATGINGQQIDTWELTYDSNDLDIIFDERIEDNRLGAISAIADGSTALFRFDGSEAQIFQRGLRTTNPNLRKEKVRSAVDIEEVYATCEVIGRNNVRSGTISADNPPSYVDDHKEIRTVDIETKEDAVARAIQFLKKHGDVEFSGQVDTLPTMAPLGEKMDGSHFNHGQAMFIKSVRYSDTNASIKLGFVKNIGGQIVSLSGGEYSSRAQETSKGLILPVGTDEYAE